MKYLEFDIKNMVISRTAGDKSPLISGANNYFGIHFNFDDEFAALSGMKAAEFFKNRNKIRVDIVEGSCAIPNVMLEDKLPFEVRVIGGNRVATPWFQVAVTESGTIQPETPEEDLPETLEYVKTMVGESAVALIRKGKSGLEFSQNGGEWEAGINGIPDVPKTPKDASYVRKNGDWVQYEAPESVQGLSGEAATITELAADAELPAVIAKINEVIGALKARGVTV